VRRVLVPLVAVALLAACGDPDGAAPEQGSVSGSGAATPSSVSHALPTTITDVTGRQVTVESIERIVPIDGDVAEIVFALGLGDRVVADDMSATYPPEADAKPEIGYQRALSAEPIAAFEPTVVIGTDLAGPPETLDQLRDLGVPVVIVPRAPTLDGPADKIRAVAAALGVPARGEALVQQLDADVAAARAEAAKVTDRPRVAVLYLRGDKVQLIFGKGSGSDVLVDAAGGIDVGTDLGIEDNAPITAEAMLRAAPDVIVVTTTGLESVGGLDGLLSIDAIARTPAGRDGRVLAYEDQLLLGGGPRTGQMLRQLVTDLHDPTPQPTTTENP
jgi:iron complex transport system substrate-binding protein